MITTKLRGGLGNQLFQYAIGQSLTRNNQADLRLDISNLESQGERKYALDDFRIQPRAASEKELALFLSRTNKAINKIWPWPKYKIIKEKTFSFAPEIFKLSGNVYLSGYWQSWKYFSGVEKILKKELVLKEKFNTYFQKVEKKINNENSISLHVRRGDYLTAKISNVFPVLPASYYSEAINTIQKKEKAFSIFVFSDDIDWARSNLKFDSPLFFIEGKNNGLRDSDELILMSWCKHNIIANSSFGWWAAWLNSNPEKTVIAPKNWFQDKTINLNDLLPTTWTKI